MTPPAVALINVGEFDAVREGSLHKNFCQAKVEDLDLFAGSNLDVSRLQIPVNDAFLMRRIQTSAI